VVQVAVVAGVMVQEVAVVYDDDGAYAVVVAVAAPAVR